MSNPYATSNPYAPPQAAVLDIADPGTDTVPAERATRLGAAILDGLIFGAMVYIPVIFTAAAIGAAGEDRGSPVLVVGGLFTLVGLVAWIWLTIRFVLRNGQTIGKKLTGIKVVRSDGSPVSLSRIFWLRNVVNGIISVIPFYGLVEVLFIFSESRQCLHDKMADTIVIRA
jgi:uncharacterized RDD family membrane protein YckC